MTNDDLIMLLSILSKNPALIRSVNDDELDTEFGKIRKACMGSCVEIVLHNNIVESIDVIADRDYIEELYAEAIARAKEFGMYILKEKLRLCYEGISNNSDSSESN